MHIRYLRAAIILVTFLLIGECLLYPAGYTRDYWFPGFSWIGDADKVPDSGDYFVIVWQWIAIEIVFFVIGAGVVFTGIYLPRRNTIRFIGLSLFLSALVGFCVHLLYWLPVPYIDYRALLSVDVSLLIGFLTGLLLLRKQRRPRRLKLGAL